VSRPAGAAAASKRPAKRPPAAGQTASPTADPSTETTVQTVPSVDGTAALKSVPHLHAVTDQPDTDAGTETAPETAEETVQVIDLTALEGTDDDEAHETGDVEGPVEPLEAAQAVTAEDTAVEAAAAGADDTDSDAETETETDDEDGDAADEADAPQAVDPDDVPPIDAAVLLRAIMTPPNGIENGDGITDALTGAVPTWRLDEEPIYLEVVRDLGVPALPEAEGGAGEVIVGEVVAG